MSAEPSRYTWVGDADGPLAGPACIVVASAAPLENVFRAYGAQLDVPAKPSGGGAGIRELQGGGCLAVEPVGGYQGIRDEVLSAITSNAPRARAAAVYWSLDSEVMFAFAGPRVGGQIDLTDWDGDVRSLPKPLRAWAKAHFASDGDQIAFATAMATEFTGVDLRREDVAGVQLLEVNPLPPGGAADEMSSTPLVHRDPELTARIGSLSQEQQRRVAEWVGIALLDIANLNDDPAFTAITRQFGTEANGSVPIATRRRLGQVGRDVEAENRRCMLAASEPSPVLRRLWLEHWTGYVLEYACHHDSATAAWRAVYGAAFALANVDILAGDQSASDRFYTELQNLIHAG